MSAQDIEFICLWLANSLPDLWPFLFFAIGASVLGSFCVMCAGFGSGKEQARMTGTENESQNNKRPKTFDNHLDFGALKGWWDAE